MIRNGLLKKERIGKSMLRLFIIHLGGIIRRIWLGLDWIDRKILSWLIIKGKLEGRSGCSSSLFSIRNKLLRWKVGSNSETVIFILF